MTLTADTDALTTNGWAPAPAYPGETPTTTLAEIDRLREERDAAEAGRNRIEADFESFKIRVATVGEAAARRHGWCGTYDAILAELGLTRSVRRITGTITVTVNFEGTPNDAERALSHDFVRDSLRLRNLEATDWFDSDWEDMDLTIDADQIVVSDLDMTDTD